MEKTSGSESGKERGHSRMGSREFDALDYGVVIQEMHRKLEAMEFELGDYRERSRGIEKSRMPRRPFDGRGGDHTQALVMEVNVPRFDGKGGVENFLEWIQAVDENLELKERDGREVVEVVAMSLRGYASIWWDYVKRERKVKGKEEVQTWRKMRRLLKERFMPSYLYAFQDSKPNPSNHPNPPNTTKPPTPLKDPKTPPPPPHLHLTHTKSNTSLPKCPITLVEEEVVELEDEVVERPIMAKSNLEEEKRSETKEVHTNLSTLFPLVLETEHEEEKGDLDVTLTKDTKLGGSQTMSLLGKEESSLALQGTILPLTLDSIEFELANFCDQVKLLVVNVGLNGGELRMRELETCLEIFGRGVKEKKVFMPSRGLVNVESRELNLERACFGIMLQDPHLDTPSLDPKLVLENSKIGNEFELREITCDHELVMLNLEELMIPFVVEMIPCVERVLEGGSDSSQAGGNDAGASLTFSTSLKHKWREKELKSFSTQSVGGAPLT